MYAPQASAVLPARVLLVSGESAVAADMSAMRGLGISSFALCPTPEQVPAALLGAPDDRPFEAVVCPSRAKDDTAPRLAAIMAANAKLSRVPLLFLCSDDDEGLSRTGAVVLKRPYAFNDLAAALQKAMSPLRPVLTAPPVARASAPRKVATVEKTVTNSDLLRAGHAHLQAGRVEPAAKAFAAVLSRSGDLPEACLGMAAIERTRDNPEGAHPWIVRAAAGYLRRNDEAGFSALLPHLPQSNHNIFAQEASAFMTQGLYRQACRSFIEASQKTGEPLHSIIARACAFSDAPKRRMEILCDAFEAAGHSGTAKALRLRLLHEFYEPGPRRVGWLDRFPLLQEIVCVAGWTAQAWRHA